MAKDDYYVIVYKILAYLYCQLKQDQEVDEQMLAYDGKLFKINRGYWLYIFEHMIKQGYIEGLYIEKAWGREQIILGWDSCRITPDGIAYLIDNSLLEKAKQFLKDVKSITPFI